MAEIMHRVQMSASPAQVYDALIEPQGEGAGWWTRDTQFAGSKRAVKMRPLELEGGTRLAWQCVDGPPDWIGTDITFDLAQEGDDTIVRFSHRNWKEPTDFMGHCSAKWALFLFGLKSALEAPEPDDLYI